MGANEKLGQFFNDEDGGLPILAKNLTIYGADELPEAIDKWSQKMAQQQQQAQQMQQQMMQQDPRMLKAKSDEMKVQLEAQQMQLDEAQQQFDNQMAIANMAKEKILADAKVMEAEAAISESQIQSAVRLEESQTSLEVHSLEAATKLAEIHSREHDKAIKTHAAGLAERKLEHEISQSKKEPKGE